MWKSKCSPTPLTGGFTEPGLGQSGRVSILNVPTLRLVILLLRTSPTEFLAPVQVGKSQGTAFYGNFKIGNKRNAYQLTIIIMSRDTQNKECYLAIGRMYC